MFDAIILTGGRGSRLGGKDKASIELEGETLLRRALHAVRDAGRRIVVGPQRIDEPDVIFTTEDPPGGGPVAGIEAGLAEVESGVVVILAVDYPHVDRDIVNDLVQRAREEGAVALEDEGGNLQPLAGAYVARALNGAFDDLAVPAHNAAVKDLLFGLKVSTVRHPKAAKDIDTPEDLEELTGE